MPDSACREPPSTARDPGPRTPSRFRLHLADLSTWAVLSAIAALTALLLANGTPPWLAAGTALAMATVDLLRWRRATAGCPLRAVDSASPLPENLRVATARLAAAELALDRVNAVIESLREGVVVVDASGEVVLCNPAARGMMADPSGQESGRQLADVLPPELALRAAEALESLHLQAVGDKSPVRCSSVRCGDEVFDLTAVPVHSARSQMDFGTVFMLVNTTRSHELARLKDRFLSSISHELRTPLTNICAYAEILLHLTPGESAEWPEFARVIASEGHALSATVDAVFDYLQLESGDALLDRRTADATASIRAEVDAATPQARSLGVELQFTIEREPPHVHVDLDRLRQVVRHLIANGLKFTPPGGRVRVALSERDGAWLLRVDDTGPGVPALERLAVFDKFHQLRDHLTEKPSGAGLGLATARAIVSLFGGAVWCEDSPLGGAGFVVRLPAHDMPKLLADGGVRSGGGF